MMQESFQKDLKRQFVHRSEDGIRVELRPDNESPAHPVYSHEATILMAFHRRNIKHAWRVKICVDRNPILLCRRDTLKLTAFQREKTKRKTPPPYRSRTGVLAFENERS